jgi:hypothetical protein
VCDRSTGYAADDHTVAGVDGGFLAFGDVFGLGFGDFDFGFEAMGIGDAGQVASGYDVLAHLHWNDLQNAFDAGADVQGIEFAAAKIVESALLVDVRLLYERTSTGRVGGVLGSFVFELGTNAELLGFYRGELRDHFGADALCVKFFVHLVLDFCLFVIAVDRGGGSFLIEEFAVELVFQILVVGFGGFELIFGIEGIAKKTPTRRVMKRVQSRVSFS